MKGKKTMRRLRRSLREFGDFVDSKAGFGISVDGEEVSAEPFVCGMEAMAAYVDAVASGEVAPDRDPERLTRVLVSVAWLNWLERKRDKDESEGADNDGTDGDGECSGEDFDRELRDILDRLDSEEGGDDDGEE